MTAIDTVLFDADGVFQRTPDDFLVRLTAAVLGPDADPHEPLLMEIFNAEVPALSGQEDFAVALAPVLQKWNARCDARSLMTVWEKIDVDQSMLALIAELRAAGVTCAVASNQQHYRATHMSERLGYAKHFDHEFYSCHLGHAKPSAEYFREILRRGGFDPARTLFLDDREQNVRGAQSVGIHAVHFELGTMGEGGFALRKILREFGLGL
jgi:putative hydrolase of the HAD superfamily